MTQYFFYFIQYDVVEYQTFDGIMYTDSKFITPTQAKTAILKLLNIGYTISEFETIDGFKACTLYIEW